MEDATLNATLSLELDVTEQIEVINKPEVNRSRRSVGFSDRISRNKSYTTVSRKYAVKSPSKSANRVSSGRCLPVNKEGKDDANFGLLTEVERFDVDVKRTEDQQKHRIRINGITNRLHNAPKRNQRPQPVESSNDLTPIGYEVRRSRSTRRYPIERVSRRTPASVDNQAPREEGRRPGKSIRGGTMRRFSTDTRSRSVVEMNSRNFVRYMTDRKCNLNNNRNGKPDNRKSKLSLTGTHALYTRSDVRLYAYVEDMASKCCYGKDAATKSGRGGAIRAGEQGGDVLEASIKKIIVEMPPIMRVKSLRQQQSYVINKMPDNGS